jgi:imidazolonepropionase-like amidohydrolase
MATLDAARNMKLDARSGSIAPGKDADLILIDGDPTRDIRDLRNVRLVIKSGWTMSPTAVLDATGLGPATSR